MTSRHVDDSDEPGPGPGAGDVLYRRIVVTGIVQGVGFRPFVWRHATRLGLSGWVENTPTGVVIEVAGAAAAVESFCAGLATRAPPLAVVTGVAIEDLQPPTRGLADASRGFAILASSIAGVAGVGVPADVAACAECLAEVVDPQDRRHHYPFTNCTNCGPRYSIIMRMPYDRAATTMQRFMMCPQCAAEYADPADRRFHAQPNGCPDCGPQVWFVSAAAGDTSAAAGGAVHGAAAIEAARDALLAGRIVAVKGVGGYRLACVATAADAVARLRAGKQRPTKPLAVLVSDLVAADRIVELDATARRALESAARPVVIVPKRRRAGTTRPSDSAATAVPVAATVGDATGSLVAADVAPGTDTLGVMLPDAPLHHLLASGLPPLVMTSGNRAGEPIVYDEAGAAAQLAGVADAFLVHDRPIHAPCDDPVVRCMAGLAVPVRQARGTTPLVLPLADDGPVVVALGGDLKAAPCILRGGEAICGPHVGDLGSLETLDACGRLVEHLLRLYAVAPEAIAADLHPGWVSTAWARRFAAARGIPLIPVQHHEAHVAALAAEQGGLAVAAARGLLGICLDGTGWGHDGTIRGAEVVWLPTAADPRPRRVAALAPLPLPGGDAAAREPWRAALALLHAADVDWDSTLPPVRFAGPQAEILRRQLAAGRGRPLVGSMGRLFDAVAALCGLRQINRHEAEAALALEAAASAGLRAGPRLAASRYRFGIESSAEGLLMLTWRDLVGAVVADLRAGVEPEAVAAHFHAAVACAVTAVCTRLRQRAPAAVVGLTGGVFQNAVLTELTVAALEAAGFEVALHQRLPPNDGGLAVGQALLARHSLARHGRGQPPDG